MIIFGLGTSPFFSKTFVLLLKTRRNSLYKNVGDTLYKSYCIYCSISQANVVFSFWLNTFFSVPCLYIFMCALPLNHYDCLSYHSGGWSRSGTADPHCSQGTVCGHDHPLHANRTWLHPFQRLGPWKKHLQLAVTFLHGHVDWYPHCIPANWSLHIPGWQVSKTENAPTAV